MSDQDKKMVVLAADLLEDLLLGPAGGAGRKGGDGRRLKAGEL
jgi:hypothetical protein